MKKNNKIIAYIFARSGSKGIKNKNIVDFHGKPLIAWSIELALKIRLIDKVIVSTDSTKIASIAREYGAEVPFIRPKNLSQDSSSEWLAWRHALLNYKSRNSYLPKIFISLPCTSPLRNINDVKNALNLFINKKPDILITATETNRNPWFNMIKIKKNNISLVNKTNSIIVRRQDAPKIYDMTTVAYIASPNFILNKKSIFDGKVEAYIVPKERAIDIDDKLDLLIAKSLFKV